MPITTKDFLLNKSPCSSGRSFAEQFETLQEVWEKCDRADWMLWILWRIRPLDIRTARKFACLCVRNTPLSDGRTVWDLLSDERSRSAVETVERWLEGTATDSEVAEARSAAYSAAHAAYSAAHAAYAAYAAVHAAVHAASYAAYAAAHAAYAAADTDADAVDAAAADAAAAANATTARTSTYKAQANILRSLIPNIDAWIEDDNNVSV